MKDRLDLHQLQIVPGCYLRMNVARLYPPHFHDPVKSAVFQKAMHPRLLFLLRFLYRLVLWTTGRVLLLMTDHSGSRLCRID